MDTIQAQLVGGPQDGKIMSVTAEEMRTATPVFVPFFPSDATAETNEVAYTEYVRVVFGTEQGQIMIWADPTLEEQTVRAIMNDILEGRRSPKGIWLLKGADFTGQLKITPLEEIT